MIDEAEPLGYPVVVKSTRGHRGQCPLARLLIGRQLCDETLAPRCRSAAQRDGAPPGGACGVVLSSVPFSLSPLLLALSTPFQALP